MLEVKRSHDCYKPSMVISTETVEYPDGRWWKRTKVQGLRNIYETADARYTCEVCGSKWMYHAAHVNTLPGFWSCEYRSEFWEEVPEQPLTRF